MAVYDCFPFFNENDLLELRLNQHWDYVDKFIFTEAGETHTGVKKPFNFDHKRFNKYKSKIIYHQIKDFKEEFDRIGNQILDPYSTIDRAPAGQWTDDWVRDHMQGNYPVKILKDLDAKDDDIIYISSIDEILKEQAFKAGLSIFSKNKKLYKLKSGNEALYEYEDQPIMVRPSFGFVLDLYIYKYNLFCKKMSVAQMTQFSVLKKILPSTMRRFSMNTHDNIDNAGWHFSWMDDADGERVLEKQKSWAHSRDFIPDQKVKFLHESKEEALERLFLDYETKKVDITPETHPRYLIDNLDKYKNYIL